MAEVDFEGWERKSWIFPKGPFKYVSTNYINLFDDLLPCLLEFCVYEKL